MTASNRNADAACNDKENTDYKEKNKILGGVLYLVATPIGNLSDISQRAIKVLSEVDFIAAEDTRNSGLLLSRLGIPKKQMISYFEHNKKEKGESIAQRLSEGQSCALITDAGTPGISDPGEDIVRICTQNGITVTSIPGCCAAVNALILSGLPTSRFVFEGFLPNKKSEKNERLSELSHEKRTVIIYEAPHRLISTLGELYEYFGDRQIAICREMTKLNEQVMRTSIGSAIEFYKINAPRGEYVLIIEGANKDDNRLLSIGDCNVSEMIDDYIRNGMARNDAIKKVAKDLDLPKSRVYDKMLEEKNVNKNGK